MIMQGTADISRNASANRTREHQVRVAIALTVIPCDMTGRLARVLAQMLAGDLQSAGVHVAEKDIGCCYTEWFCIHVIEVAELRQSLAALKTFADRASIGGAFEVAYFCQAEEIWRTVHGGHGLPFDRFFSPENLAAANAKVTRDIELSMRVLEMVRAGTNGGKS